MIGNDFDVMSVAIKPVGNGFASVMRGREPELRPLHSLYYDVQLPSVSGRFCSQFGSEVI